MDKLVKSLTLTTGKQGVWDALKAGGWRVLLDGNLGQTVVEQQPGARLVGTDDNGNKYFERDDTITGRNRWVQYADLTPGRNPADVPPEWHGWLHDMVDDNPTNHTFPQPIFASHIVGSKTGTPERYLNKGSWFSESKRSWRKWQQWKPEAGKA